MSSGLSTANKRVLRAFAEAWFWRRDPAISVERVVANLDSQLDALPKEVVSEVRAGLHLLEMLVAPGFSRRSIERRRKVLDGLHKPGDRGLFHLKRRVAALRTLVAVGYYQDHDVHPSLGFKTPDRRPYPDPVAKPEFPLGDPPTGTINTDICVIGSGAGGAVAAYHLAKGHRVLLIEAGPFLTPPDVSHNEAAMTSSLYVRGGLQSTRSGSMTILQGRCLGGSTFINNCICFRVQEPDRTHPDAPCVFSLWERGAYGTGVRIDRTRFAKSYTAVEKFLGIELIDTVQAGPNAEILLKGWQTQSALDPNAPKGYFRKNYTNCVHCGYCNSGCRYGRKRSTLQSYIDCGLSDSDRNLTVLQKCWAESIEHKKGAAVAVECRVPGGNLRVQVEHAVVVSGGVIASSQLLRRSGIFRNVGRRISFNAGTALVARHGDPVNAWNGVQQGSYVDRNDYLLESLFHPPMGLSAILAGWDEDHFDRMQAYNHLSCAGILLATPPRGRLTRGGKVDFDMKEPELRTLREALKLLARIQESQGAIKFYPPTVVGETAASVVELDRQVDEHIKKAVDLTLNSSHPQGGNVMSKDAVDGVVDAELRVHGFENLFVCDASVFPTAVRVNPQLTIMALAHYFATSGVV